VSFQTWLVSPRSRLDVVAGVMDGILNALILAAGLLLKGNSIDIGLISRVSAASAVTTLFVFFVAHYAELRTELARVERQLSLTPRGRLGASRLGRQSFEQALAGAALAAVCGFIGAALPLLISMVVPRPTYTGPCITIVLLGVLGGTLARSIHGSMLTWSIAVMAGGGLFILFGLELNLVS